MRAGRSAIRTRLILYWGLSTFFVVLFWAGVVHPYLSVAAIAILGVLAFRERCGRCGHPFLAMARSLEIVPVTCTNCGNRIEA